MSVWIVYYNSGEAWEEHWRVRSVHKSEKGAEAWLADRLKRWPALTPDLYDIREHKVEE